MLYISIFLIIFFSALLFSLEYKAQNLTNISIKIFSKGAYLLIVFVLIFLSAFRYNTGVDYLNYIRIYETLERITDSDVEIGFCILNKIIKETFDSFYLLQMVISFFCGIIVYQYLYRFSKYPFLSLLVYFVSYYFTLDMGQTRQWIAMSFLIIGIAKLSLNDRKSFFIYIFIAMLFHVSAIIIFPLFLFRKNYNKSIYILLLIFTIMFYCIGNHFLHGFFLFFSKFSFLPSRIIYLLNAYVQTWTTPKIGLTAIVKILIYSYISLLLIFTDEGKIINPIFKNSFFIYFIFVSISKSISIFDRIATYFLISGGGIFSMNLMFCKYGVVIKKQKLLRVIRIILFLLFISYPFYTFTTGYDPQKMLFLNFSDWNPYKSIFFDKGI